ncbi:phosphodiester glycosidase family protein [Oculatella sp. FACHB-28]|uniref:phosphodiester glycosidase family protein n=1 Tax=Oculatella sp. FACHB-28 TaxID=2692845 RepID=UPI0016854049|nr:phosphodiester glycosidase family protein [Oculatella sp. FACHB-28]MBD2058643.1 phosphodiester glycosidase family protein [Oculatella sp. FACHB-28]
MNYQYQVYVKRFLVVIGAGLLTMPLLFYGKLHFQRPPRTDQQRTLFQGIVYRRIAKSLPRPVVIHVTTIDLTAPGIRVFVTPGMPTSDNRETQAQTTSEFVDEFDLQLAVNASFFYPFEENTPWNYYPHSGDRTNVLGQGISNGLLYSPADPDWPVLCFADNNQARIAAQECPSGTVQAIAGSDVLIEQGDRRDTELDSYNNRIPYPRVAAAINRAGNQLFLIVVDGKQPLYSEGVTTTELTEILLELGAYSALNLDGGGSTTLVAATSSGTTVLNAPIHTKVPMRQRPVANNLGIYAIP